MTGQLTPLLEHVLHGEPELGDEIDRVFRRADRMRRRRTRGLIAAGVAGAAVIVGIGYVLTDSLLPSTVATTSGTTASRAAPDPSAGADPVLALITSVVDGRKTHLYQRPPERGDGWRQYSVADQEGEPRGTVEVAVYTIAGNPCFPTLADPGRCAKVEWAPAGIEYVRYDDDHDAGWQVHQTIARRISDGRTVAVMATGERGAGDASRGRPGLTGTQVERVATDRRLFEAFGATEQCSGPSSNACPAFRVPVPAD